VMCCALEAGAMALRVCGGCEEIRGERLWPGLHAELRIAIAISLRS